MLDHIKQPATRLWMDGATALPLLSFDGIWHTFAVTGPDCRCPARYRSADRARRIVAIVGASGCGKSTLLRIASGLLKPNRGTVSFSGEPLTGPSREISMIFQDAVMLPWFSVIDNVTLPVRVARRNMTQASRGADSSRRARDFADSYPTSYRGHAPTGRNRARADEKARFS